MNVDGGRAAMASKMEIGATSEKFVSTNGDCYYYIKLLDKSNEQVSYVSVKIPFTELAKRLRELRDNNKVKEYINIPVEAETKETEKPAEEQPAAQ